MLVKKLFDILIIFHSLTSPALAKPIQDESLHRLPLRKIPVVRDGEHPMLAFQRHHNSAIKRLHHFTRTTPPDHSFFVERYQKRVSDLEASGQIEKRLWFAPLPTPEESSAGEKRLWFKPVAQQGELEENRNLSTAEVVPLTGGRVLAAGSKAGIAAAATTTVAASGSNANGFSKAALSALLNNAVTPSSSKLISGGLDYQIEAHDAGYLADIQIGTPAKTYLILMDSGSGDTWVPSSACSPTICGDHTTLGSDSSRTFKASAVKFSVTYGSGMVAGNLCSDTMSIAGMTLANQVFGVTTQESIQFSSAAIPFDGLMGLSFNALSNQRTPTPIDSLVSSGKLKSAIMGYALGRIADGENNGEIVFGAADTSKLDASTTQTLPVTSTNGFWQTDMGAVTVNGRVVATDRQAVLDTGTTLMIAPGNDVALVHAQIPGSASDGQGGFTIPCTTTANVALTFGDAAFSIDARDMIFQPIDTQNVRGQCISALSSGTLIDNVTWLIGDSFLKNVYFTTNVQARTIQLSARTDSPGSSSAGKVNAGIPGTTASTATSSIGKGVTSSNQAVASSGADSVGDGLKHETVWFTACVAVFALIL